jgi:hypothetical protein
MKQPFQIRNALHVTALLITCFPAHGQTNSIVRPKPRPSTTTVQDYFGNPRIIFDYNQDGWDDLWCSTHKGIAHRDKTTNTDGDGMTDYEEMIAWRNPFVKGPLPRKLTPEEIEEAALAAAAAKAAALEEAKRLWPERSAKLAEHLQPTFEAGKEAADPDFVRNDNEAVRARLIARRDKAAADQAKTEAELDRIAAKQGVERFDKGRSLCLRRMRWLRTRFQQMTFGLRACIRGRIPAFRGT